MAKTAMDGTTRILHYDYRLLRSTRGQSLRSEQGDEADRVATALYSSRQRRISCLHQQSMAAEAIME